MVSLAAGKARTGRALHNPVPVSEGRVTTIDAQGLCSDDEGDRQRCAGLVVGRPQTRPRHRLRRDQVSGGGVPIPRFTPASCSTIASPAGLPGQCRPSASTPALRTTDRNTTATMTASSA